MRVSNSIWCIALLLCIFVAGSNARAQGAVPAASSVFTRNLTLGSRGGDVSALQQFLITGGFLKILTPTGYFGPLTKVAIGAWQTATGIYPSAGYFGPISRGKINATVPQAPIDVIQVPNTVAATTTTAATTSAAVANTKNGSPVRLRIPTLAVDAGFQFNGLKSDGTMEIPNNITDVGWYTGSPHPGETGNAIITGHVAQIRRSVVTKQGVFYNLSQLRQGDNVYVLNDKGQTITFVVRASRLYDPAADATDVFVSTDDRAHLVLITCEGAWNQAELSYSQRLVVFADAMQ
jgi:LPXTG-site transpeptidase (sortase) family protein